MNRACRWGALGIDGGIRRYGYGQVVRATMSICRRGELIAGRDLEVGRALGTRNEVATLGIVTDSAH